MSEPLEGFPVEVEVPVAWGDMDAFRHVNNTVFFRWFETGRIAYFLAIGWPKVQEATGVGPILAATSCRFKRPVAFPDRIVVAARVPPFDGNRFTMEYRVASAAHGGVAAEGEGLIVPYDYRAKAKAALPEEVRRAIEALEGR